MTLGDDVGLSGCSLWVSVMSRWPWLPSRIARLNVSPSQDVGRCVLSIHEEC